MLRLISYLLISVVLISILRMVIGVVTKAAAGFFSPSKPPPGSSAVASEVRAGGELKRDPVCGTFIPVENAVRKTAGGEVVYFCSEACRDKHRPV
jgi:YHS domain-containing protein